MSGSLGMIPNLGHVPTYIKPKIAMIHLQWKLPALMFEISRLLHKSKILTFIISTEVIPIKFQGEILTFVVKIYYISLVCLSHILLHLFVYDGY